MLDKQSQKAGNNSQQLQANTIFVTNGISEERVRAIIQENLTIALKDFATEAIKEASKRNEKFGENLIKKMVEEKALQAFADPSFLMLLKEAQKRAASTEREPDYHLLTELMLYRFKNGKNRTIRAGISRAVEIVDQISDEALIGLTLLHAVSNLSPIGGDLSSGLEVLNSLFGKLFYRDLPTDIDWLDHLDILNTIRLNSIGGLKLLEDYWYESWEGYIKCGIAKDSDQYSQANEMLMKLGLQVLKDNSRAYGYVRIEVAKKLYIPSMYITTTISSPQGKALLQRRMIEEKEIEVLNQIYDMYDGSTISKQDFIVEIDKYSNLRKLRTWWNSMRNKSVQITSVGRALAHTNAQRVDSSVPPLD